MGVPTPPPLLRKATPQLSGQRGREGRAGGRKAGMLAEHLLCAAPPPPTLLTALRFSHGLVLT